MTGPWRSSNLAQLIGRFGYLGAVPAHRELVFRGGQAGVLDGGTVAGADAQTRTRQDLANSERRLDWLSAWHAYPVEPFTMVVGARCLADCRATRQEVFANWHPDGERPAAVAAGGRGLSDFLARRRDQGQSRLPTPMSLDP